MPHEIAVALIRQSRKVLLGRRSPGRAFFPDVWDLFGGHVEPGEAHRETLVRELQEELGITPIRSTFEETLTQLLPATPELTGDLRVHGLFCDLVKETARAA